MPPSVPRCAEPLAPRHDALFSLYHRSLGPSYKRIRNRSVQPSSRSRAPHRYSGTHARQQLATLENIVRVERDDLRACARYLAQRTNRARPICGRQPTGPRVTYCARLPGSRISEARVERIEHPATLTSLASHKAAGGSTPGATAT